MLMITEQKIEDRNYSSTEHPHIVTARGVRGGRPIIKGTAITVDLIASFFKTGDSVEEILLHYPHLKAVQVYDAIAYYLDHQQEIENYIQANRIEDILEENNLQMDNRGLITTNIPSND